MSHSVLDSITSLLSVNLHFSRGSSQKTSICRGFSQYIYIYIPIYDISRWISMNINYIISIHILICVFVRTCLKPIEFPSIPWIFTATNLHLQIIFQCSHWNHVRPPFLNDFIDDPPFSHIFPHFPTFFELKTSGIPWISICPVTPRTPRGWNDGRTRHRLGGTEHRRQRALGRDRGRRNP